MERIREVIVKQQQDLAEARQREQGYKASAEYDEESLFGDKSEGGGGFAGADPKNATAAIERKLRNGDEVLMAQGLSAMLVDYVRNKPPSC